MVVFEQTSLYRWQVRETSLEEKQKDKSNGGYLRCDFYVMTKVEHIVFDITNSLCILMIYDKNFSHI